MSRAFTKERDDVPEPAVLVERAPAQVTASGFAALRARAARADAGERERLTHVLDTAIVVAAPGDRSAIAFGATVEVDGAGAKPASFTIVGDIEADPAKGKIGISSPLADALLGRRVGDRVVWHRPVGDRRLTVRSIAY